MSFSTINPTTGELLREFPLQTDAEIFEALSLADRTYREDWRLRPVSERAEIVGRAAKILRERRDEYAALPVLEMGKIQRFSDFEIDLVADILEYYATNGERLLAEQPLTDEPGAALVAEPIGVVLAIEPWNFPFYQVVRVAAPQLVAGNVVMIKHAENVPQSALAIERLFEEAGAPRGAYTNLFCSVEQVATLIDDFRVRGVTLTGSERAGTSVGARAGASLKKVVLELGGSDPALILEGAPLDHAVDQVVMGRTYNSGQGCVNIKPGMVFLSGGVHLRSAVLAQSRHASSSRTTWIAASSAEAPAPSIPTSLARRSEEGSSASCWAQTRRPARNEPTWSSMSSPSVSDASPRPSPKQASVVSGTSRASRAASGSCSPTSWDVKPQPDASGLSSGEYPAPSSSPPSSSSSRLSSCGRSPNTSCSVP